jgi:uncharacterized protein with PhoU and TrkA domain
MLTDQDIDRLKAVFATTEEVAALRKSVSDLLATLVHHEREAAKSTEEVTALVSAVSATEPISQAFEVAALKAELEHLKQLLREHFLIEL